MRLTQLKITSRHAQGWASPTLEFGPRTTSLYAPNGSGKTPVVQSVAFCLGQDVKFREDIRENCKAAALTIWHNDRKIEIERDLESKIFEVRAGGGTKTFESEADFSRAFLQELGTSVPNLVATNKKSTIPYLSTILPIFYVRQDGGYLGAYSAPTFIADQFVEIIRFIFGFSPKKSYDTQRELLKARERLEAAQRKVVYQQKVVSDLSADIDDSPINQNFLKQRGIELSQQIEDLRSASSKKDSANSALIELLQSKDEQMRNLRRTRSQLQSRIDSIDSIRSEIQGEIRTLSLNEESRRALQHFSDICSRSDCGLFAESHESYGKNLLYLKDQIKDLESNVTKAEVQITYLDESIDALDVERSYLRDKINEVAVGSDTSALVLAVQNLTRELMVVEQNRISIERLIEEKRKYIAFDEERFNLQDSVANLSSLSKADLGFNRLRFALQLLTTKWMDILGTPNVPRNVTIEPDFRFRFGNEFLDAFTGSTRARLVLAIHAAIFEKYMEDRARPFRFLILDTPKQHELESSDLARYLDSLQDVCDKFDGQIIVSSTEYRHPIGLLDREWLPTFSGFEKLMYLGRN
ncbi:hypothetical protein [Massilia alkalitolerans]|uniref:hypothetical protein n=1 Tax=Massilia alkalitolerans TaxID=286638 RepID=UPI0028A7384C|nr:hypothetical protein [Massilia alkalitolerans]